MFKKTLLAGAGALLLASSFALVASAASTRLNYDSQTPTVINVNYFNVPATSTVRFVNVTSGAKGPTQPLPSGSGTMSVPIGSTAPGAYYLLAQDSSQQYLAQTVVFYISDGSGGDGL